MQPARAYLNGGSPGYMSIFGRDQLRTASAKIHHARHPLRMRLPLFLVRCTIKGQRRLGIAIDEVNFEARLSLYVLQELAAIAGLANGLGGYHQYLTGLMFCRQSFILAQRINCFLSLLLRNLPRRRNTFTNAHQFNLVLDNVKVIWRTVSYNQVNSIATNIDSGMNGCLLLLHQWFLIRQNITSTRKPIPRAYC